MSNDNDKPRTPQIEPLDYIGGVKVVDIGDLRVARGKSRRPFSTCGHRQLVYDMDERRIWCKDCETDVEPFDAFVSLVERFHMADADLKRRLDEIEKSRAFSIRHIATKKLDEAWRSRTMVPACPHCGNGLFPEHFKDGFTTLGREYAEMRLKREKKTP